MKQQSKALRLLFYHLRHTFLVSTQPVAFVKVLVGLLVGGMFSDQFISSMWVLHQKELRRTLLSATTVLRLYSVRIFTIHPISCEVRVAVIHGLSSARCCVHSYTLSTRIPCLGRFDLSIFVLDFAQMEPLVPLHSFSQLGPSPRTTCFKLQTVSIFEFKWEG